MLVLNISNTRKTLQSNYGKIYFPPGISSHPSIDRILNYVNSHSDLSIVGDPVPNKTEPATIAHEIPIKEEEPNTQRRRRRKHSDQGAVDGVNS
jgi:hypothetical protein